MCYSERFENYCDTNRELIGFNNGVYDLYTGTFRKGNPDDYITLTTGYNYIFYAGNEPIFNDVDKFMKNIQRNDMIRNYAMILLAGCLKGRKHDINHNYSNNYSENIFVDFVTNIFGKYVGMDNEDDESINLLHVYKIIPCNDDIDVCEYTNNIHGYKSVMMWLLLNKYYKIFNNIAIQNIILRKISILKKIFIGIDAENQNIMNTYPVDIYEMMKSSNNISRKHNIPIENTATKKNRYDRI
jgi:hypothetical protein